MKCGLLPSRAAFAVFPKAKAIAPPFEIVFVGITRSIYVRLSMLFLLHRFELFQLVSFVSPN